MKPHRIGIGGDFRSNRFSLPLIYGEAAGSWTRKKKLKPVVGLLDDALGTCDGGVTKDLSSVGGLSQRRGEQLSGTGSIAARHKSGREVSSERDSSKNKSQPTTTDNNSGVFVCCCGTATVDGDMENNSVKQQSGATVSLQRCVCAAYFYYCYYARKTFVFLLQRKFELSFNSSKLIRLFGN